MKNILLIGAGKSATVLIDFLQQLVQKNNWLLTVADNNEQLLKDKVVVNKNVKAVVLNLENDSFRKQLILGSDIVVSMMPPHLHLLIAKDCLEFSKHLLTASYVDDKIKELEQAIKEKNLLFLCEMGLDPGIDHMSAMKIIHEIKEKGGEIISFKSHCGGLIAPENDNNPWHYKISWNPKNIILAGKSGAIFKQDNNVIHIAYNQLFNNNSTITTDTNNIYAFYPNRDSLNYINTYHLQNINTFVRTTLRHPDFCAGWNAIIKLQLTNEEKKYQTDGMSLATFFKTHFATYNTTQILEEYRSNSLIYNQLIFLGLTDNETLINKGLCSAAEVLQIILENKLALSKTDKDLIVMLHEIEYTLNHKKFYVRSLLELTGSNQQHTAMAKTVGLPLGIAVQLILENKIKTTGLHIPILPEIYTPVLNVLHQNGIKFIEKTIEIES
jgi:saccharopine dehydrogenase-like NADP-dependent oxidoreductase